MTFYEELFQDFHKAGIRYLIVGGVAVILHGFVRATADLDLMLAMDPENLKRFLELLKSKGYRPKAPVPMESFADPAARKAWIEEKGMKVFSLYHPKKCEELIDVFVEEQLPFADAYDRRHVATVGTTPVDVMQIPDLIALKKKAGRPQDLQDITGLEHILRSQRK